MSNAHESWTAYFGYPDQVEMRQYHTGEVVLLTNVNNHPFAKSLLYSNKISEFLSGDNLALHNKVRKFMNELNDVNPDIFYYHVEESWRIYEHVWLAHFPDPPRGRPWFDIEGFEPLTFDRTKAYYRIGEHSEESKWREEGRCPHCGEFGRAAFCAFVCSTHGPY